MKNIALILIPLFITSCASIGAVIDGGQDRDWETDKLALT